MDENKKLTDEERVELTKLSYAELELGESVEINDKFIGIVSDTIYADDGMRAFVITNPNEVTILFKGSYGFLKGNPTTWRDEWLNTNLPILLAILANEKKVPSQLKTASDYLNKVIHQFRGARFYIYGHSLGSINAQYALANCRHPQEIIAAYLYEGTNIWLLLDQKQRRRANKIRNKIYNYVDIYDPVTLGITATHHMVGKLQYVDSEKMQLVKQHMWGGYKFDKNGNLKLREIDENFLRESRSDHELLDCSEALADFVVNTNSSEDIKKIATEKIFELAERHLNSKTVAKLAELIKTNSEKGEKKR